VNATDTATTLHYDCARDIEESSPPQTRASTASTLPASAEASASRTGGRFRWLTRPRRILLLLSAVWVLNIFDLGYTLLEADRGSLIEMNPVAAPLLTAPSYALVIYKAALVLGSSAILLMLCHHRVVEVGCWLLLASYLYVAGRWIFYYEDLADHVTDPAVNIPCLLG
jgi:hypothetical protein